MVLISKNDKNIWKNYVSNFEKYVFVPQVNDRSISKNNSYNPHICKKDSPSIYTKSFKKKGVKPNVVLDLHGHTLYSAKIILNKYIINCYDKNIRNILIITGKGRKNKGVLKEEVPKWLNDKYLNRYLVSINFAPNHFGGEGALLIRIKNRFKKN